MLKVGDTVKVIAQDDILTNNGYDTIGYIGKIIKIDKNNDYRLDNGWWYGKEQLIKGRLGYILLKKYLKWLKMVHRAL